MLLLHKPFTLENLNNSMGQLLILHNISTLICWQGLTQSEKVAQQMVNSESVSEAIINKKLGPNTLCQIYINSIWYLVITSAPMLGLA